jgi:GT2 family glycosyltransferase
MRTRKISRPVFVDMMTKGNPIITSGACVRRSLIDRVGVFSEDTALVSVEDFDLWLRISLITDRFIRIPRALGAYWVGTGNISSTSAHIQAHHALFDKYKIRLALSDERESFKYFSYCMGLAALRSGNFRLSIEYLVSSLKSHNPRQATMSLIRIMESLWRQMRQQIKSS